MYVPNLSPLVDAHFACDDEVESDLIMDLMDSFKNESPWPRRVYSDGLKKSGLSEYSYKALGEVCDDFYEHQCGGRGRGKKLEFPPPPKSPPPSEVGPSVRLTRAGKKLQQYKEGGEARVTGKRKKVGSEDSGKGRGRGNGKDKGKGKVEGSSKRGRGKGKRMAKPRLSKNLRFAIDNPPPIVCALPSYIIWPDCPPMPKLRGGKEKVDGGCSGSGKEKDEGGCSVAPPVVPAPRSPTTVEIFSCFVTSDDENHSDRSYDLYLSESGDDFDWSILRVRRRWVPRAPETVSSDSSSSYEESSYSSYDSSSDSDSD